MRLATYHKCALMFGASALALGTNAAAQQVQDEDMTLGEVVVTVQKRAESIQDVPIAVSAFDESAIEKLQLAGGPDLVKTIPNVTFTKGNFSGSNFKIRGIGNDAVGNSTDGGVGVHQNFVPLTSNRLFEAEFYDVERVETLRGPQGTLYGRNATGGIVNIITAKPVLEEFQGRAQLTAGNVGTFKAKGMVNVPIGETIAFRGAGSYLQRDGFAKNTITGNDIDGRDLFSLRASLGWEVTPALRTLLVVEHFEEDDTRLRSGKQLCRKDPFDTQFMGIPIGPVDQLITSQGCVEAPLDESNGIVNSAATLGGGLAVTAGLLNGDAFTGPFDPDLRNIESAFDPIYKAEQTFIQWQAEIDLTDTLQLTYIGSINDSQVKSIEDYNKVTPSVPFNTVGAPLGNPALSPVYQLLFPGGVVNDPQLGPSNLLRTFDQSFSQSDQYTNELRLQSDYDGRFNFSLGAIKIDYEIDDINSQNSSYYVFSNSLTALSDLNNAIGGAIFGGLVPVGQGSLFDSDLTGLGGNYFRSFSPYTLDSTAVFGEAYIDATDELQFTIGLRYTDDKKEQTNVPTFLFTPTANGTRTDINPVIIPGASDDEGGDGTLNADFQEVTGRAGFDWNPVVGFSDDTLVYAFYSRGYKGGGINPPQPAGAAAFPQFFDPEFINAYEIGTKNTLMGGRVLANANAFFYEYEGYQITQIINRTSANFNVDAQLAGLELEGVWNPVGGLQLNGSLGLLNAEVKDTFGVDVLDRTGGRSDLVVLKDAATFGNCVVSAAGYATVLGLIQGGILNQGDSRGLCAGAFEGQEAVFGVADITYTNSEGQTVTVGGLTPFEGEAIDLDGNSLPGAPEITFNVGAEYIFESDMMADWQIVPRIDFYYQGDSFSRVWNTGRDELESWSNVNLGLRFTNPDKGLAIEFFGKNVTDEEVITGSYLTDDSSGLFTNIFLTEPRTYGVTLTKEW